MKTSSTGHQQVKLSDVVERHTERYDDPTKHGLSRYVKVEHFDLDNLRLSRWGQADDGQLPPTFKFVFRSGMVLYPSRSPNLRQYASPDFDGICGEKTFVIKSKDPEVLLPELVPFLFSTDSLYRHCNGVAVGSVNAHVRWRDLVSYEFALPPLEEQRRIAEVLQAAQRSKLTANTLLQSTERLVLAAYKEVFQSPELPPRPLAEIADVRMGRQRSPVHQHGDHMLPYLRAGNIKDGFLDLSSVLEMNFDPREQEIFALAPGDILVTEGCGSLSQIGANSTWESELPGTVCFQNTVIRLRAIPAKIEPELLKHWAKYAFRAGVFAVASRGTNVFHIGSTRCAQIPVQIPDISRQRKICERLSALQLAQRGCEERYKQVCSVSHSSISSLLGESE